MQEHLLDLATLQGDLSQEKSASKALETMTNLETRLEVLEQILVKRDLLNIFKKWVKPSDQETTQQSLVELDSIILSQIETRFAPQDKRELWELYIDQTFNQGLLFKIFDASEGQPALVAPVVREPRPEGGLPD